ncbi:AcrR family transcriptional regulator [Virgibacillus halotolerans]|uniref:TetR/AcrR family transcriptional regulator n=1 Tax=Virgibacillus halotolerans TaxID=1071053 RepID=UPI00195F5A06|nr:TetR/AcrR family transcriptional regulator [Virgibacillus halotolerans]MBM7600900.1 AcrR family transcriptional regulator [Virgibacillus halotolerans]
MKKNRSPGRPPSHKVTQPTNELILQTAAQLFLNHSYSEVSMDDVAIECNITKATVYYYFNTKAVLYTETMIKMMERIRGHIMTILVEDKPLKSRLLKLAITYLTETISIDIDGIMRGTKNTLSESQTQAIRKEEDQMYQVIANVLEDAMKMGEVRKIDPIFAAHAYMSLLTIDTDRNTKEGTFISPPIEETAENIIDFFWRGISKE